jgi:two-component sensor histidine kinase/FixJ family two-component response regulator
MILVEDNDSDAELVMTAAKREGLDVDWLRADDEPSFLSALGCAPAAIVTDFNLPSFSALRVLEIVRERGSELPVLVVTGAIDDELAAECVKQGAADYLLKDRLARLRDALEGALERFRVERQKREAERRLLAEAASRAVLNDILLNSLAVDLTESSLRSVLKPLFVYASPPQLDAVRLEAPDLTRFTLERPGLAAPLASSAQEAGAVERDFALDDNRGPGGRITFIFAPGAAPEPDVDQFLGEVAHIVSGVIRRARAETGLRKSLAEQEELLREIHHRVKNNLAAVQSLVSIEASRMDEGPGKSALAGIEGQVRSMSLVHEMLYSRGGFTGIDFEDYVRELKLRVADSARCPQDSLTLLADCGGLSIPLEAAVTVGILFNELFAHAAARAAADHRVEIRVEAHRDDESSKAWRVEYLERSLNGAVSGLESGLEFVEMFLPQYEGRIDASDGRLQVLMQVFGNAMPQAGP